MPTYTFICDQCEETHDVVMSIAQYTREPPRLYHCAKPMRRHFGEPPALGLTNDTIYEGLRAPDGTDISTRAKHRAYMRENNLTTVDDFKETWAEQARKREQTLAGVDPTRREDIARAIDKLGG